MSPSTGPHQFQMKEWISCAPFEQLLNMQIVEAENGRAILTMPFHLDLAQGAGLMHGGALVSLADTAVVMAIKSIVPPLTHFATISLETKFLYPVKKGIVTANANIVRHDKRIIEGKATVVDENHNTVIEFSSTFKIAQDTVIHDITFADNDS